VFHLPSSLTSKPHEISPSGLALKPTDFRKMSEELSEAVGKLQLQEQEKDDSHITNIDGFLDSGRPRKKQRQSLNDLRNQLEQEFLTPSARFSPQWLNRLQQYDLRLIFAD
jgi:antiviral helicase SKI2